MQRTTTPFSHRSSGVLLHITSLPGHFGIGDLGPAAYAWVDWLAGAGQTWWQILPLSPPDVAGCPYRCFSAFAGNPLLISPELLVQDGLLRQRDLSRFRLPPGMVNCTAAARHKRNMLDQAWTRFVSGAASKLRIPFARFKDAQSGWLADFALYLSLREAHRNVSWLHWPRELAFRRPTALGQAGESLAEPVARQQFIQFLFFRQLNALRRHARARRVRIIGDIPIFVATDSADVWANPHLFLLDRDRRPKFVAGVPPDYFSRTGQRWGNPLYAWPAHRKQHFAWWIARIRATLEQVDVARIDHFRGFEACWHIPASAPDARKGKWIQAPGAALFQVVRNTLGRLPLIAEDLGVITPQVHTLREQFGLPGMRVLQFAFGGEPDDPNLPHNHTRNTVVYTGTHDNDTTLGWYKALPPQDRKRLHRYLTEVSRDPAWSLIRMAWSSVAACAIAPLQDILRLPALARMNTPGTKRGNWTWRLTDGMLTARHQDQLADLTRLYARSPDSSPR